MLKQYIKYSLNIALAAPLYFGAALLLAIEIKKKYKETLKTSLHVITALYGEQYEYMEYDLLENQ